MELVLHLGAHRTGTTALQRALTRRRHKLAACGVGLWGPTLVRQMMAGPVMRAARLGEDDAQSAAARGQAGQALAERFRHDQARGITRLIVSDENLIGTMPENLGAAALYPNAARQAAVLAGILPVRPSGIWLSVRAYHDYWASAYAYCATRRAVPDFGDLAPDILANPRGWVQVLTDIAAAFPQVPIRVWVYSGARPALTRLAADIVGPQGSGMRRIRPDWRNQRPAAAEVARSQADRRPALGAAGVASATGPAGGDAAGPAPAPRRFMPFIRRARVALRARYALDLDALRNGAVPDVSIMGRAR